MDSKATFLQEHNKSTSISSFGDDDKYSPRADDDESSPRIISLIEEDELASRSRGQSADYYHSYSGSNDDAKPAASSQAKASSSTSSPPGRKLSAATATTAITLDLSGFSRADGKSNPTAIASDSKDEYFEPAIQEKDVLIVFELPDGSQGEKTFKYGHTIELLKSFVEGEYGIPMTEQCLYLDDRKLDNPFSLLDYPEVKGTCLSLVLVA